MKNSIIKYRLVLIVICTLTFSSTSAQEKWVWNSEGKRIAPDKDIISDPPIKKNEDLVTEDPKYFGPSDMHENPIEPGGIFKFDFELEQFINFGGIKGDILFKVNSADNSMYFSGVDLERSTLLKDALRGRQAENYDIHFAIRNSKGEMTVYADHEEQGKVAIYIPADGRTENLFLDNYLAQMEFLNNAKANHTFHTENLEFKEGSVTQSDGSLQQFNVWFDWEQPRFRTSVPLMGFGAGIFKDYRAGHQRILVVCQTDELWFQLKSLEKLPQAWGINTEEYRLITSDFHTRPGQTDIANFMTWMANKEREIRGLREQWKNCPPHQRGAECRNQFRDRIKAIEREIDNRADTMMHGRTIPD